MRNQAGKAAPDVRAAITANARYLAWISAAYWVVPYDQNGLPDVFWRGPLY